MSYVIPAPTPVGLPVVGSDALFPVRRVYCVARNYAAHALEMGADPMREPPFFFSKYNDAQSVMPIARDGSASIPYPSLTHNLHHEVELVVVLQSGGQHISVDTALQHVYGYAIGLDMTRRDLQTQMKDAGRPWEIGKAFDYAAPIGAVHPVSLVGHVDRGEIQLNVNGTPRQHGNINQLTWNVAETISKLSEYYELHAGDVIFTGTPEGVGAVQVGDVMHASIAGLGTMTVRLQD